jgi:translation initiation factor IF-3
MKKKQKKFKQDFTRVNEKIKFSPVRVVKDGQNFGVIPLDKAKQMAFASGLDLVEIAPQARPPVCSIMDYGKFKYQQSIKEKEKKQKQKTLEMKEIRLRPKTGDHDIETKAKAARKFLEEGRKLQLHVLFKSREYAHKDEGFKVVEKFVKLLEDISKVEMAAKFQGNSITCRLMPQ